LTDEYCGINGVFGFHEYGWIRRGIVRWPGRAEDMKLYVGVRTQLDRRVVVTSSTGQFADYSLSAEPNNLPDLKWACAETGAGLALAILSDHLGDVRDTGLCRRFEEALIATLPANFWVLSESEVAAAVERFAAELS
jgi:uncharacterized protein DUF6166